MRHRAKGRQLSRTSTHKRAMLNNMASSLFEHGRVVTTEAKAKELRPFAEKLITLARRGDLHARRLVERRIKDRETLGKLLGDPDNFDNTLGRCAPNVLYPEFGLSFASAPGAPASDLLVSMGCNQVVSRTFSWPHPATGMKADTVADLSEIFTKIFPQGT